MKKIKIIPIAAFKDNYIWALCHANDIWVVDPGDASPVIDFMIHHQLTLKGILITHHHHDHSGGIADLLNYVGNIPVYGGRRSSVSSVSHFVQENDVIDIFSIQLKVLEIPGHTLDHVAYYNDEIIFCGDTLFSAGCGKVFEGTYQQMDESLKKIAALSETIKIYCGHEYTLSNLYFAQTVEPSNSYISERKKRVEQMIKVNGCTLPSVLKDEKNINPFLRGDVPAVISAVQKQCGGTSRNSVEVFQHLREWKNNFKV